MSERVAGDAMRFVPGSTGFTFRDSSGADDVRAARADSLHAETLAMLEDRTVYWGDNAVYRARYAHAAACVRFVAALDSGEIVQFSGWGNGDGPQKFGIRLRGADALAFGFGPTALAAYAAATREGTDSCNKCGRSAEYRCECPPHPED